MLHNPLMSLETLTGLESRPDRQQQYLQRLKAMTRLEVQFFFKVFNHTAMRRTIDSEAAAWIRDGYGHAGVDGLLQHYGDWFATWLRARNEGNQTELNQAFDVLEDLNIAAIAFRRGCCLDHARQFNRQLKDVQQKIYSQSNN